MKEIGVDCTFTSDGQVRVRRIEIDGQWQAVEQGRQWLGDDGRHVLVMLRQQQVAEIVLHAASLTWELHQLRGPSRQIWAA
jgi:hypothetical protein